jgi:hypothetical protein
LLGVERPSAPLEAALHLHGRALELRRQNPERLLLVS